MIRLFIFDQYTNILGKTTVETFNNYWDIRQIPIGKMPLQGQLHVGLSSYH